MSLDIKKEKKYNFISKVITYSTRSIIKLFVFIVREIVRINFDVFLVRIFGRYMLRSNGITNRRHFIFLTFYHISILIALFLDRYTAK